ncbi:MAG TPA: cytochrome c [Thiobacillaceae bacterium]
MKRPLFILAAIALGASLPTHAKGNYDAGKAKSTLCAGCHGADGNSTIPSFPRLAGQQPDYIVQALKDYKAGRRKNPIMAGMAGNLSDEDMADLAAYFSEQKGLSVKY